jgi:hypothetical protein
MQTAGGLHDWLGYINGWYETDFPDKRISYIQYITASALILYMDVLEHFPDWSKKPFLGKSKKDQAEVWLRHDPDGAVAVTKPWDLLDYVAENVSVQFLPNARENHARCVKEYFG